MTNIHARSKLAVHLGAADTEEIIMGLLSTVDLIPTRICEIPVPTEMPDKGYYATFAKCKKSDHFRIDFCIPQNDLEAIRCSYRFELHFSNLLGMDIILLKLAQLNAIHAEGFALTCEPEMFDHFEPRLHSTWPLLHDADEDAHEMVSDHFLIQANALIGRSQAKKQISSLLEQAWSFYLDNRTCDKSGWMSREYFNHEYRIVWQGDGAMRDLGPSLRKLRESGYLEQLKVGNHLYYRPTDFKAPVAIGFLAYLLLRAMEGDIRNSINECSLEGISAGMRELAQKGILVPGTDGARQLVAGTWLVQPSYHPIAGFEHTLSEDETVTLPDPYVWLASHFPRCEAYREMRDELKSLDGKMKCIDRRLSEIQTESEKLKRERGVAAARKQEVEKKLF